MIVVKDSRGVSWEVSVWGCEGLKRSDLILSLFSDQLQCEFCLLIKYLLEDKLWPLDIICFLWRVKESWKLCVRGFWMQKRHGLLVSITSAHLQYYSVTCFFLVLMWLLFSPKNVCYKTCYSSSVGSPGKFLIHVGRILCYSLLKAELCISGKCFHYSLNNFIINLI